MHNASSQEHGVNKYSVTCEERCPDCQGTCRSTDPEFAPPDWDGSEYTCVDCEGAGRRKREMTLIDAVRALDEEQNRLLYARLPWRRYADLDIEAGTWLAHNEAATRIAHTLTGYEQWRSVDEMARGLASIPHMTFQCVRVAAIGDGTLTLDVEGKNITLYNRDDRAGDNIWTNLHLAKAWRGNVGTFGMLRLTSFGWAFVSYDELHALRGTHAEGVSRPATTEERKDD